MADEYHQIVKSISNSIDFLETFSGKEVYRSQRADIYAAHEGLHLLYEQSQTRFLDRRERWYSARRKSTVPTSSISGELQTRWESRSALE
jgi:3-deoxy-D-arabino-heptulosonate 7-phosphate (DAHP) synthase class II